MNGTCEAVAEGNHFWKVDPSDLEKQDYKGAAIIDALPQSSPGSIEQCKHRWYFYTLIHILAGSVQVSGNFL